MSGDRRVSPLLKSGGILDSELTALIGACALDPSKWQTVLDKISGAMGGLRTQMFGYDLEANTKFGLIQKGYAADALEDYLNHYGKLNVWLPGFDKHGPGYAIPSQSLVSREELERSAFYQEWVRPQEDITAGGAVMLFKDKNRMFALGGNIPSRLSAQMQPQFLALLGQMVGPMQQAFEVNRALAGLSLEKYVAGHVASQVNAIVLLSPTGLVLYSNCIADDLMATGAVLKVDRKRKLQFADPVAQDRLEASLHPLFPVIPKTFSVNSGDSGQSFTARLLALQSDGLDHSPFGALIGLDESAFILALTPAQHQQSAQSLLIQRFGLTMAEARVADAIAQGLSPQEMAQRDLVSVHTIRTQLKAAMAKTGSSRQAQLAAKVTKLQMSQPDI